MIEGVGRWPTRLPTAGQLVRVRSVAGSLVLWVPIAALMTVLATLYTEHVAIGLVIGSIYALSAVGLTLIQGIVKVPHFAHGDAMMLSAYLALFLLSGSIAGASGGDVTSPLRLDRLPGASEPIWRFSFGYGLIAAFILAAVLAIPLLIAIDRVVYRRLRQRRVPPAFLAVASLGVAIAVRGSTLAIWGPTPRGYSTGIRETVGLPGGVRIVTDQLFILLAAVVLTSAVYLLLYRSRIGTAMRATADNPDLALVSGINTDAVVSWTWVVAGVLVATAGCLLALQAQLTPELGFALLLPIFASAILGGIGSPHGALVGGLIVGITSEVAVGTGLIDPGYKLVVAFAVLVIVILARPRGLFGADA